MKLFFFLIAFCLILLRAYFVWPGHGGNSNEGSITITNGDYSEKVKWSGKVSLSEDERSIAAITPGGYLKFKENDSKMTAEANLKGELSYTLYNGYNDLPLDDSGRNFIAGVLKKMIARGFYADGRAERIYKKGGYKALIAELPNLQMENLRNPYFDLLFKSDSLSGTDLANTIIETGNSVSDIDKENFLNKITPLRRKDSLVASAWLDIVTHINSDIQKTNLLSRLIEQDSMLQATFDKVITIIANLNSDLDKISVLSKILSEGLNDEYRWNQILEVANHFNSDLDKQNIFIKLTGEKNISETQWVDLINSVSQQNSDLDKSNLLIRIAQQMPMTEKTRTAYSIAAKKINDDAEYGRAIKQIQ